MKKFSTAVRALCRPVFLAASLALAFQTLPAQAASQCAFRANAPDQHTVVRGDTLWDISGRFLEHPWCWPQVWGLNREQIRDPHWIYPGQVVIFAGAAPRRRRGRGSSASGQLPEVRLSPQSRVESLARQAVPSIPPAAIEPFLTQPLVVEEAALAGAARVVATEEGHLHAGLGDKLYVLGDLKGATTFQVFRPAQPLKDPADDSVLGYEAAFLGTARLERAATAPNEAHRFVVASSKMEITQGARLLPLAERSVMNYVPHPPASRVDGRVVHIYEGITQAARNNVVVINRGARDGIDVGTVLSLVRAGRRVPDPQAAKNAPPIQLPDESFGTLFVFRVFDRLSYGLIMNVTDAVRRNDIVRSPD